MNRSRSALAAYAVLAAGLLGAAAVLFFFDPAAVRFYPRCPDAIPDCQETDPQLHLAASNHEVACIRV